MAEKDIDMPLSFRQIPGVFPMGFERSMGYTGAARFVGFWWHDEEDDVACTDGHTTVDSTGAWEFWTSTIAPNSHYFRTRYAAVLGALEEPATHLLVWDRLQQVCYLAPRDEAEEFLAAQPR